MSAEAVRVYPNSGVWWWCPGCDMAHRATLAGMDGPAWEFNGDVEHPTLSPSVLTRWSDGTPQVCHCFMRDGSLEFLPDCTHSLAGQTVAMCPLPADLFPPDDGGAL